MTRVSVYNKAGHQRDLGDLRQGREDHACSMYDGNNGNEKVIINLNIKHYSDHCYQLLIVTGGYDISNLLDTTEIYQDSVWRTVTGKLPVPMFGMRIATASNKIFLFGIKTLSYYFIDCS